MPINERIVSLEKLEQYSNETSENIKEYVNDKISEVIHPDYDLVKKNTADEGFTASYNLTKNGEIVGATINIPKDYLVKSADIKVVEMADTPVEGYVVGDKYIDFVVNTVDDSGNVSHIYLLVTELVDVYKAGDGIVISIDNTITLVTQDGTKTVGGVSAEDYNNFKGAYEDKHTHSNMSVLDGISEKTLNGGAELSGSTGYTVNDSVEYPLVGLKVYGKSKQKQYSGKNLLNATFGNAEHDGIKIVKNSDGTYTASGTASHDFTYRLAENIYFENGKPYKLVGCPSGGSLNTYFIASNTLLYADIGSGISRTPDRDINNDYVYIYIKEGVTCNNLIFKPMLTTDLTATYDDYEPYVGGIPSPNPDYPQEIVSVVEPTVTVFGKNLINAMYQTTTKGGITCTNNSNGTYTLNGTATSEAVFTIVSRLDISGTYRIIGCPPNGSNYTYNISVNVDGKWSVDNYDIGKGSIINSSNYIIIAIAIRSGVTCNNLVFKPMLTTDLTATYDDFEPYTANALTLTDTLNAIPVSSGGNVVIDGQEYIADYVDFERGIKVQRVEAIKLSANNFLQFDINRKRVAHRINQHIVEGNSVNYTMCNCLIPSYAAWSYESGSTYFIYNTMIYMWTQNFGIETEEDWKTFIANNDIIVYHALATPIETPISESELQAYRQLQTYNGVTNIINDKGAGLSVEYCTSKMLAEYALPLIKDLEAENAKKDEEISVLKQELDKKVKTTDIQDNLESAEAAFPLSANQGKILNEKIAEHTDNGDVHVTTADKSKWNGKFDSNQGTSNAGKLLGTNSSGDVVAIQGYGFEYNEETKMLKYGTDPTTNLNQGIGLDDTLSKKGYAAEASAVGELKSDLVEIEEKVLTQQSNINWLPKNKHEGWGFWNDGTVNKNNPNTTMSDYIRVNAGDIIFGYSLNNFNDCVFYDESYNMVQYMQWHPEPSGTIVPTGSKYMRFSVKKENYDTTKIYINPLDINIDNVETLKYTLNKIGNGIGDLHFNIHIKAGTYNITFTSDEINSAEYTADGFVGLVVGNNVNLIGDSKDSTIISCEIDTSYSVSKRDAISTLNIKGNCKLENLTVKSKNIRYPIHDDFPQSIDTIHKIKNCSFIAGVNAVRQKTCGYGLGTRSGETIIFDNCYIEPNMTYHNNTGFTKSSLVTMNNCEISEVFNLWDFDCEVPCYLELNNIKCPQLNHSYNGTHEQTINISGIGSYPDIVTCSSDVKYFLGNCVKKQIHYGALSGKCMVDYYASNDPKFRTAATGTNGLLGIMLEDVGGDKIGIIQTNGYISANKLGATDMSSWTVGTLLKPNTNTAYLEPTTDISLAVAKVVFEIDSVKYIKLLF